MAHQIETIAYTNEEPWHGLGTEVKKAVTVDRMLKLAGLDWTVEKKPIAVIHSAKKISNIDDKYALVRSSDKAVLDVCGKQYIPVQNKEAFKFFKEFVEAGKAKMETAGSLRGGKFVWGLANLNASFTMRGDDKVKGYVLVAAPHEVGKSFVVKFTTVRVVCNNTLSIALKEKGQALTSGKSGEFRMPHRCNFDDFMIEKAKSTLGIAREQLVDFEKAAKQMQKLNLNWKECLEILQPIYQPNADLKELQKDFDQVGCLNLKHIKDIFERAPGAQPDNGWGLLNAVTYFSDHVGSRTADKRLTNAWFGHTAHKKELVLNKILERV